MEQASFAVGLSMPPEAPEKAAKKKAAKRASRPFDLGRA